MDVNEDLPFPDAGVMETEQDVVVSPDTSGVMETDQDVVVSPDTSGVMETASDTEPPVIVVVRGHGRTLVDEKIPPGISNLFRSQGGQITFLRKAHIGDEAFQNQVSWDQLFRVINEYSYLDNKEDITRAIIENARGIPDIPNGQEDNKINNLLTSPLRYVTLSHGTDHEYKFFETKPDIFPQNSKALGIYDTDVLDKLIPPGSAPSGNMCGIVLKEDPTQPLPLGNKMPVWFDNTKQETDEQKQRLRVVKLSEIADDLSRRYRGRNIILIEISCRDGPWTWNDVIKLGTQAGELNLDA